MGICPVVYRRIAQSSGRDVLVKVTLSDGATCGCRLDAILYESELQVIEK